MPECGFQTVREPAGVDSINERRDNLYMIAMVAITIVSVFIAVETSGIDVYGETRPERRAAEEPAGGVD